MRWGLLAAAAMVLSISCGGSQKTAAPVVQEKSPRAKVVIKDSSLVLVDVGNELVPVKIRFALDSDELSEDGKRVLDVLAEFLVDNEDLGAVEIRGHSDARGRADYNLDLSARRAQAVAEYLTSRGVEAVRLNSRGMGDSQPACQGSGEEVWSANRRVEFLLVNSPGADG